MTQHTDIDMHKTVSWTERLFSWGLYNQKTCAQLQLLMQLPTTDMAIPNGGGGVEPEQDLLTCGNCQREFSLSEITKFIQHKVSRCNKENVEPFDDESGDFDANDESMSSVISNRRTSISAPIANKAASEVRDKQSPRPSLSQPETNSTPDHLPKVEKPEETSTPEGATNKKENSTCGGECVDVACNTVYTEPGLLTCSSCRSLFTSAWSLLQHAQRTHGVKIYYSDRDKEEKREVKQEKDREHETNTPPPNLQPVNSSPSRHVEKTRERELDLTRSSGRSSGSSIHSAASLIKVHPKSPVNRSPSNSSSEVYNRSPPFQVPRQPLSPVAAFGPSGPFCRPPFSPEINHEIMDPFRTRFSPFGTLPPGLEHAVPGFPFRPPGYDGSTSLADYYSKKLQQLAQPNTFITKHLPNFMSHTPFGHPSPLHPTSQSNMVAEASKSHNPYKTKSCEFCHKQFKSSTYLVIHRRSHTGEKPFKCPICSYACSQASKLKKHLKIHSQLKSLLSQGQSSGTSINSENSLRSNSSTPDSKCSNMDEQDDDDEVDDDHLSEEILLQRETLAEDTVQRIAEKWRKQQEGQEDDEDIDEGNDEDDDDEGEELSRDALPNNNRKRPASKETTKDGESPEDLSLSKEQRVAILSEVMKDTGLGGIAEYKEAYSEALKESGSRSNQNHDVSKAEASKENVGDNSQQNSEALSAHHRSSVGSMASTNSKSSGRNSSHADLESPENKKVKLEPQDNSNSSPSSHIFPNVDMYHGPRDIFHPGMWHFGRRDLMNIVMPGSDHPLLSNPHHQENGMHESALTPSPKPVRFSTAHTGISPDTPTGSMQGVPMSLRRRNDTCEFCGKIFKNCSNLTVHRRSHTGEKPYSCELCNYACAQSSKLTRHMRTHGRVGMDVFRCKFCNMPFSVASTLEKHMRRCVEKHQREAAGLAPVDSPTGSMASSSASNASPSATHCALGPSS